MEHVRIDVERTLYGIRIARLRGRKTQDGRTQHNDVYRIRKMGRIKKRENQKIPHAIGVGDFQTVVLKIGKISREGIRRSGRRVEIQIGFSTEELSRYVLNRRKNARRGNVPRNSEA